MGVNILICELILALVSLWLLVNSFKETFKEKHPIGFFIILLLFCLFQFKRGYCMNDRLDFISTVIKQYYNSNDRLKFILLFIRWENDLNKWLKHVKKGRKENKQNENKSTRNKWGTLRVHIMNWKIWFRELTSWRPKNDEERWRTVKNLHEITHGNVSEALRKCLGLDFFHGNNFPH